MDTLEICIKGEHSAMSLFQKWLLFIVVLYGLCAAGIISESNATTETTIDNTANKR